VFARDVEREEGIEERGREGEREKGVCLCFANTGIHHGGMLATIPRMPWAPVFVCPHAHGTVLTRLRWPLLRSLSHLP